MINQDHTGSRPDPDALLTRGEFGRRALLSPKALRLYHDMGLLAPVFVDPVNGYRYYHESQIRSARLIGLLRRLDMALVDIAAAVDLDAPELVKAIGVHWQQVEADHDTKKELVRFLVGHLTTKGENMFTVQRRHVPAQRVATIRQPVLAPDLPEFIGSAMHRIHRHLAASNAEPGVPFVVYHGEVNLDADGPVEVCVPYDGALGPVEHIGLRVEPAHRELYTRITKRQVEFPGILLAYEAVEETAVSEGNPIAGSPREVYFVDFDRAEPDEPACDIALPVS